MVYRLRRAPRSRTDSDSVSLEPIGVLSLDFDDLRRLETLLRSGRRSVRVYAGGGLAPRGVQDLDDATRRELRDVKFVVSRPALTVRLGDDGAYIIRDARAKSKSSALAEEVRSLFCDHGARMVSWSLAMPPVFWCLLWHASNVVGNGIHVAGIERVPVWVGNLILAANLAGGAGTGVALWALSRRLRQRGAAFIRPVRAKRRRPVVRVVSAYMILLWIIAGSFALEVIIGALFFDWRLWH